MDAQHRRLHHTAQGLHIIRKGHAVLHEDHMPAGLQAIAREKQFSLNAIPIQPQRPLRQKAPLESQRPLRGHHDMDGHPLILPQPHLHVGGNIHIRFFLLLLVKVPYPRKGRVGPKAISLRQSFQETEPLLPLEPAGQAVGRRHDRHLQPRRIGGKAHRHRLISQTLPTGNGLVAIISHGQYHRCRVVRIPAIHVARGL